MERQPVENGLHRSVRGRAHQRRQRGVAVADRGDRLALPPALVQQRRAQQGVGLPGHAAHQGEAPGGVFFMLHLAADRLEVPDLVARHCTNVGAIEHDNGPVVIRCGGLGRLARDNHDLCCRLPVDRLELHGDGMGADAQALVVRRRDGQQAFQNTRTVPEQGACAQFGLHPLQLRRAASGQQRAGRRNRHRRQGRCQTAAADLEPRRLDLDRAEQRLQPARAPVLERLQQPSRRTDPMMGHIGCHLAAQHACLQPGQQRLGLGASTRPISASVLTTPGRLSVTSSVVFTSPWLVFASSRTVHCIQPAPVVRRQPGPSAQNRQARCPRLLTLPSHSRTARRSASASVLHSPGDPTSSRHCSEPLQTTQLPTRRLPRSRR